MSGLTISEQQELENYEIVIERGLKTFVEVGNALMDIRDKRLYRAEYSTFEDYCQERWGLTRRYVNYQISAAQAVDNLGTIVPKNDLPETESQARPLTKLSPQLQREVWPKVIDTAPNGKITAGHVQSVVDEYSESVCQECGQVYDGPHCSDCHPFNYKRDNKVSRQGDVYTPKGYDACQTPPYAIDPLIPYLRHSDFNTIWEPAQGDGYLVEAFYDASFDVIPSDIIFQQNFFHWKPDKPVDCVVTNPPYSIKYKWLERCYEIGLPFALLMPVEVLGAQTAQNLFEQYQDIAPLEIIFLDKRINFKMPNKGWDGGGAQFPVAWFTWRLNIGQQITFAKITKEELVY